MEQPFGFIEGFQIEKKTEKIIEEKKAVFEERKEKNDFAYELSPEMQERLASLEVQERIVEEKFDSVANFAAQRMGYDSVPWFRLTWVLLWIYTFLTINVMFFRADFINVSLLKAPPHHI